MANLDISKVDTADTDGLSEVHAKGELLSLKERLADLQERPGLRRGSSHLSWARVLR